MQPHPIQHPETPATAVRRSLTLAAALIATLGLQSCGAGLIVGALAGSNNGGGSTTTPPILPQPPSLVVSLDEGPLFGLNDDVVVREVRLTDAELPSSVRLDLRTIETNVRQEQEIFSINNSPGTDPEILFFLRTAAILAAVPDPTVADVPSTLELIDTSTGEIVASTPFLLRRQPTAELIPSDPTRGITIAPSGANVRIRVRNLVDTTNITARVAVANPDPQRVTIVNDINNVTIETDPNDPDAVIASFPMPQQVSTVQAFAEVIGTRSGRSTPVSRIYVPPQLGGIVGRRSDTDGGGRAIVTGQGLVPFDAVTLELDFLRTEVLIRKDGLETTLRAGSIRLPPVSSANNLVFVPPSSPDGSPGPAEVQVVVTFPPNIRVPSNTAELFAYGASTPSFEPRGLALPTEHPRRGPLARSDRLRRRCVRPASRRERSGADRPPGRAPQRNAHPARRVDSGR